MTGASIGVPVPATFRTEAYFRSTKVAQFASLFPSRLQFWPLRKQIFAAAAEYECHLSVVTVSAR
jgi:hypothetical protein